MAIGVAIGAGGNHIFGRLTVAAVHKILGSPPNSWELPDEEADGAAIERAAEGE